MPDDGSVSLGEHQISGVRENSYSMPHVSEIVWLFWVVVINHAQAERGFAYRTGERSEYSGNLGVVIKAPWGKTAGNPSDDIER